MIIKASHKGYFTSMEVSKVNCLMPARITPHFSPNKHTHKNKRQINVSCRDKVAMQRTDNFGASYYDY